MLRTRSSFAVWSVSAILFVGSIIYILSRFEWRAVYESLQRARILYFLFGTGLALVLYWLARTLRWMILLGNAGVRVAFSDLYCATALSLSLATFTPFQSGEVMKVELLKKRGQLSRISGYGTFAVERFLDLAVVLILAVISLGRLSGLIDNGMRLAVAIPFLLLGILGGLWLLWHWHRAGHIKEFVDTMRGSIQSPGVFAVATLLTLIGWVVTAAAWTVGLRSLGIALVFSDVLAVMSIMTLVNILSLIPGGAGISEAGIAEMLLRLGIDTPSAQAGALIVRCYGLWGALLGAAHWVIWIAIRHTEARYTK